MTTPTNGTGSGTTALVFQAPPDPVGADPDEVDAPTFRPGPGSSLRMLKGARAAAAGMKISDDQIRAVLEDPHDVQPDPSQPTRTRLHRDGVTVTTGNDGMILRVTRKR